MGGYLTLGQWGKCIRGCGHDHTMTDNITPCCACARGVITPIPDPSLDRQQFLKYLQKCEFWVKMAHFRPKSRIDAKASKFVTVTIIINHTT